MTTRVADLQSFLPSEGFERDAQHPLNPMRLWWGRGIRLAPCGGAYRIGLDPLAAVATRRRAKPLS